MNSKSRKSDLAYHMYVLIRLFQNPLQKKLKQRKKQRPEFKSR